MKGIGKLIYAKELVAYLEVVFMWKRAYWKADSLEQTLVLEKTDG